MGFAKCVVAAGAYDEPAGAGRQARLPAVHAGRDGPVLRQEGSLRPIRHDGAQLRDNVRLSRDVSTVVEDRVTLEDHMFGLAIHGTLNPPAQTRCQDQLGQAPATKMNG